MRNLYKRLAIGLTVFSMLLAGCVFPPPSRVIYPDATPPLTVGEIKINLTPTATVPAEAAPRSPVDDLGISWGPAGVAPQDISSAIKALQLDQASALYLTKLNPAPGDDRVIGWVVGTSVSESQGIMLNVGRFPAGTCIDFDPDASSVNGMVVGQPIVFTPTWSRVLMAQDSNGSGLKYTVYWTPCDGVDLNAALVQTGKPVVAAAESTTTTDAKPMPKATDRPILVPTTTQPAVQAACVTMAQIEALGGTFVKNLPPNGQVRDFGATKIKVPANVVAQWEQAPNNKTASDGTYEVWGTVSLYAEPLCS